MSKQLSLHQKNIVVMCGQQETLTIAGKHHQAKPGNAHQKRSHVLAVNPIPLGVTENTSLTEPRGVRKPYAFTGGRSWITGNGWS